MRYYCILPMPFPDFFDAVHKRSKNKRKTGKDLKFWLTRVCEPKICGSLPRVHDHNHRRDLLVEEARHLLSSTSARCGSEAEENSASQLKPAIQNFTWPSRLGGANMSSRPNHRRDLGAVERIQKAKRAKKCETLCSAQTETESG